VTVIRLATRGSNLALWQARHVASCLRQRHAGIQVQLIVVNASGDNDHATPLYRMGNIGVFCKEVQQAILENRADAGVHSMKDLPTSEPDGLAIAAVLERADPRDVLVGAAAISALPPNALIGTSSLRRQAQLAHIRPDLRFTSIRGNVETRLRKVREGEVAATIMAYAGLKRLGLLRRADAAPLDPWTTCTPAPAQGAVAVDCRADDQRTQILMAGFHHRETATAVGIERTILAGLAGGCSLPLGCFARRREGLWHVRIRLGRGVGLFETELSGSSWELPRLAARALGVGSTLSGITQAP
jgi:hydroxymethylbilane synthase